MNSHQSIGKRGEAIALDFLRKKRYFIHKVNHYTRGGEIDIIAEKENILVFIEVKTRTGDKKGKPYEAITYHKVRHIKRAINFYLFDKNKTNRAMRIDVISIELNSDASIKKLLHFENIESTK